ncbi:MAG: CocE/NonD family hydrolase, partial [Candidatus Thermoplasmatota archaeon]|nr:CocE/NonD family hydrolase [Candidatus Thermoplasmatota archaeon]
MGAADLLMRIAVLLTFLVLAGPLAGCFGDDEIIEETVIESYYPDIFDRQNLDWNWTGTYAMVLEKGPYTALDVQEAFIEVDTSDIWETGPPTSNVHLSYWLPSNTLEGEKVPVIAIISPYYSYGQPGSESGATNVVAAGRGEFIFDNYVPHGYALAQVSVFGTEESSGCFDYRGAGEGLGIHSAVEWLGQQNWSNGNVGLYGKS